MEHFESNRSLKSWKMSTNITNKHSLVLFSICPSPLCAPVLSLDCYLTVLTCSVLSDSLISLSTYTLSCQCIIEYSIEYLQTLFFGFLFYSGLIMDYLCFTLHACVLTLTMDLDYASQILPNKPHIGFRSYIMPLAWYENIHINTMNCIVKLLGYWWEVQISGKIPSTGWKVRLWIGKLGLEQCFAVSGVCKTGIPA